MMQTCSRLHQILIRLNKHAQLIHVANSTNDILLLREGKNAGLVTIMCFHNQLQKKNPKNAHFLYIKKIKIKINFYTLLKIYIINIYNKKYWYIVAYPSIITLKLND